MAGAVSLDTTVTTADGARHGKNAPPGSARAAVAPSSDARKSATWQAVGATAEMCRRRRVAGRRRARVVALLAAS
jgi:hypothetical protein